MPKVTKCVVQAKTQTRDAAYYDSLYSEDCIPALKAVTDATSKGIQYIWGKWGEY